jgi:hypothetical protein
MEVVQMRVSRILFALSPAVLLMGACDLLGDPKLDVQTFNLDHRPGYEAAQLIDPYVFGDRAEGPGAMSATDDAITVRETRDNLDKIARVLAEFDRPLPVVRLRFQLIEADSFRDEDPAIAEVVDELRDLFRFEGYRLMGEAVVAVGGGEASFEQPFFGVGEALSEDYVVRGTAGFRGGAAVRLYEIELWAESIPVLETSVNATVGQTLVMGGSRARGSGRTLILTVRAETE